MSTKVAGVTQEVHHQAPQYLLKNLIIFIRKPSFLLSWLMKAMNRRQNAAKLLLKLRLGLIILTHIDARHLSTQQ